MPWVCCTWLMARSRSRNLAAPSKSRLAAAASISLTSLAEVSALAVEELHRLADKLAICRRIDPPDARRRTALDLVEHAGRERVSNTESEHDRKRKARCKVFRCVDGAGVGEGTEVNALWSSARRDA